jgi:hypothetical protein
VYIDASDAIFVQDGRNQIAPQARPVKRHTCIFTRVSRRSQLPQISFANRDGLACAA